MSGASDGAEVVAVICGPTAAGKSAIAMSLAERTGRAILVADSRQVYRRFDIGTAKPDAAERRRVPHVALDLVEPTGRYSAADWAAVSDSTLGAASAEAKPLVVGGTGMYLRALFDGLFDEPELDPDRRQALLAWLDTRPTERLREWVRELDAPRAALGRTQLLRAIEVAILTGERISTLHTTHARETRWRPRYLVVDPEGTLHDRIARRFDAMIAAGWLDEVRSLLDVPAEAPAWKATGYRALREVVAGTTTLEKAREQIVIDTRQYAKRQRTWFRHQLPEREVIRVNPEARDRDEIIDRWWSSMASPR